LPLAGYGIQNLSVSPDNTVLIGQLAGRYTSPYDMTQQPSQAHAWSVDALINAALANNGNLSQHISLPTDAEQLISDKTAAPIGSFFDVQDNYVHVTGNMGDVITVNLKDLVIRQLAKLSDTQPLTDAIRAQWESRLSNFSMVAPGNDASQPNTPTFIQLVDANGALLTRQVVNGQLQQTNDTFAKTGVMFVAPNITDTDGQVKHSDGSITTTPSDEETLRDGGIVYPKYEKFEFTFTLDGKAYSSDEHWFADVGAFDYASAPNALMGDRPLNNPGYSKFDLGGTITDGANTNDRLDVYRVQQRLRYLGFGPADHLDGSGDVVVSGTLDHQTAIALQQFENIVDGKTTYDDGSRPAHLDNNHHKIAAKPSVPVSLSEGSDWLNWLNAYNAPHWMTYKLGDNTAFSGWKPVDSTTSSPLSMQGTSWVHDLMVASQSAAQKQGRHTPLQFAGAGDLGDMLNLGINTNYISAANQAHIDGDQWLLGMSSVNSADLNAVTADANAPTGSLANLKYLLEQKATLTQQANGKWDSTIAQSLANLLKNPDRAPSPNDPTQTSGGTNGQPGPGGNISTLDNSGANNQAEALKDFLTVYGSMEQGTQGTGSWNDLKSLIKSQGDADTIRNDLFGNGTQSSSIIDSNNLLLGGLSENGGGIGYQLDAKLLSKIMGITEDQAQPWVAPVNSAMAEFDINTPKRLAAFLTNVQQETHLLQETENISEANAISKYDGSGGNGAAPSEDGYTYRGRGMLQITHHNNYALASNGGTVSVITLNPDANSPGRVQRTVPSLNSFLGTSYDFVANPDLINSSNQTSAYAGAWYWRYGSDWNDLNAAVDRTSSNQVRGPIPADKTIDLNNFDRAVSGILGSTSAARETAWTSVEKLLAEQPNHYGDMGNLLSSLGIKSQQAKGYNTQFGITLSKRTPIAITPENLTIDADSLAQATTPQSSLQNQESVNSDINPEDCDVLFMSSPTVPPQQAPIISTLKSSAASSSGLFGKVGVCSLIPAAGDISSFGRLSLYPLSANVYANNIFSVKPPPDGYSAHDYEGAKVTLLKGPNHGTLDSSDIYAYSPNQGYVGNDQVTYLVDIEGYKIQVTFFLKVIHSDIKEAPTSSVNGLSNSEMYSKATDYSLKFFNTFKNRCPDPNWWQIATSNNSNGQPSAQTTGNNTSGISVTFGNLGSSVVGQESNSNGHTQITLDRSAGGYGWFIRRPPAFSSGAI
jgi:predicted chitinase